MKNMILKNPMFALYDCHLVIKHKDEMNVFYLSEISNIRFIKKRDYTINIVFFILASLIYYFTLIFIKINLLLSVLSLITGSIFIIISISIKIYNKLLLINTGRFRFKKLNVSKKDGLSAENLAWIFKVYYLEKNHQN